MKKYSIYALLMICLISSVYAGTTTGNILYDDEINFNAGTYSNTYWNGSGVVLNNSLSGSYCSNIDDSTSNNTEWDLFNYMSYNYFETINFNETSNLNFTIYDDVSLDVTLNTLISDDVRSPELNIDGISDKATIVISSILKNGDFITLESWRTDGEENTMYLHNFDGSVVYGSFPSVAQKNVDYTQTTTIDNMTIPTNVIYLSDLDLGSGATKILIDYFNIESIEESYYDIETDLSFKVRSCNDILCNNETFINISGISPINLNLDNNSYFQWCADYTSTNLSYSSIIEYVNINFHYETGEEINDTNITINPVACNFKSSVMNMYYDYPYIERGVPTTLGWRIYKTDEPSIVVGNVTEAKIYIQDQWFNLTFNELNNNYEVTLLFNETGDYYIDYPFRLYFKEDLSELCSFNWDNGYLKVRDFINIDINLFTNKNLSKTYEDNFGFVYAEIINEEMSESEMWGSLTAPLKLTNFWLDKAIVETTGVKLNLGEEENMVLNQEKVYFTPLGLDGTTQYLRVPADENMILKIMGVNTNQAVQFLHSGYSYFWYLPDEIRYNSELTTFNYNEDTTLQVVVTDIDTNPSWYYFKIFLIVVGIIIIFGVPFFTYMATGDMGQATKTFYYIVIAVPSIVTIIIVIGGFLT